ncbi:MAG: alpha-glucosidase C-terminal domain-containing protein [Muribaculaceae bacterium]|nr:alpha-glucosidase C-terminal domain-containing protein [Muribaculaceae bacterium]
MMKNLILTLLLALLALTGCKLGSRHNAQPVSDAYVVPEVADVVLYQVNPRVFAPSNSLQAVIGRLDSIQDLGVNMLWIMPIYPIGEEKSKNSPYSVRDYKAVAPEYGTVEDLRMLVESCHERGMGVILDWVANHTAWDNVWLKQHPDWYTHDSTGNIVYPPGTDWTDVADLNYDNKDMRAAMIDAMRFWVDSVRIDGFRCDVADQVPVDFWSDAIDSLRDAAKPRRLIMLAEGANPENFKAGFDLNYAWEFMGAIAKVMTADARVNQLIKVDQNEYKDLDRGKFKLRFITNHDEATKASPIKQYGGERASMAAFVATTMLHGGMLVYGSQEVGYPEPINFFKYVPVNWNANPRLREEYKNLIGIYNDHPALRSSGKVHVFDDDENNILCVERVLNNDNVLVMVNVRDEAESIDVPSMWTDKSVTELATGDEIVLGKKITLKPYQYMLLFNK